MIKESEATALLRAAGDDIHVATAPSAELATRGAVRRRRRWVAAGSAVCTAGVVAALLPVALGPDETGRAPASPADPTTAGSCVSPVPSGLLPAWARAGFSSPRPRIPHVVGDDGGIAAILFAQPLTSPPSDDHNNKVLWVSRETGDGSPLRITATLDDGSRRVSRVVEGGPGPSYLDLPEPGCWRLALRWGDEEDSLSLAYTSP
ncbi:hypothetical protein GCM10009623_15500 [Nocardioides aestuarii]|uniref:Uncharacterized protein n=1 Tax=Nocardioides aestuarii TaxID=252231 RepID=A0ABW4TML4_9ACTN